jgi:hypothetical protein
MIPIPLSARDRRTATIGSSILLLLLGVGKGLPAFREWSAARREEALAVLRRESEAGEGARLLAPMRDSLRARRARRAARDSSLVMGRTVPEAGAALASIVSDLADEQRVRLVSMQVRPDTISRTALMRVAVRVSGVADAQGLNGLLRDIEGGERALAVRELAITQPDAAQPDTKAEALRFELMVEGLAYVSRGKP